MTKCPTCDGGTLKHVMEKHLMFGVDLGTYPGEKCTSCGEVFTDSKVMEKIEEAARKKGIWGIGRKTRITSAGNSLAVRIPKNIADYLKIREGREAFIHPEGKKIIIEVM